MSLAEVSDIPAKFTSIVILMFAIRTLKTVRVRTKLENGDQPVTRLTKRKLQLGQFQFSRQIVNSKRFSQSNKNLEFRNFEMES